MKCILMFSFVSVLAMPAYAHEELAANDMAAAANNLIASLNPEQKAASVFPMDDDHRLDWHFIPKERKGTSFKEMTPQQRHLTTSLLATSLSSKGFIKTSNIMSLEEVLKRIEGASPRAARDPELYHVSIFGDPGPGKTWGWRFEGHHLSLSFTVVKGVHISSTPSMMGTNPAIVPDGPHKGLQILADEENVARELVKSLSTKQKSKAITNEKAPADILTENRRKISPLEPAGIGWMDLDSGQQKLLWSLVKTYVQRARGEIAGADLTKINAAGRENIHFAWAGGLERGQGHYYRIQGPTFLIEYDNTQNNANHIHCVYRDFNEDFGEDLLQKHYEQAPRWAVRVSWTVVSVTLGTQLRSYSRQGYSEMTPLSDQDAAVFSVGLPGHDEFGLTRRFVEAGCIAGAVALLLIHWERFFVLPANIPRWSLAFVLAGVVAADFLSGLIHWTADTWGRETMPIVGRRFIRPFRVHHVNPGDFLRRRFLDTNGDVAVIVIPFLAGMFWISPEATWGQCVTACLLGFCSAGLFTNQIHQWAHMPCPPRPVRWMQKCRLVLPSKIHERHHHPPHVTDYCIATGWCNGVLNRTGFFSRLERAVTWATGIVPREDEVRFQTATARIQGSPQHGEVSRD